MCVSVFLLKKGMVHKFYSTCLCLQGHQPQVRNPGPAHGPASRSVLASGMKKVVPGPRCAPGDGGTSLPCLDTPGPAVAGGSPGGRCGVASLPGLPLVGFPGRGDSQAACWGSGCHQKWDEPGL